MLAYERKFVGPLNGIFQLYRSPSTVHGTSLEEITEDKYQLSGGLQWHRKSWVFRLGVTENLRNFENTPDEKYPLLLHFPYFDLYRRQVVKQADLVLAMHVRGDVFTAEEKARNFAYYEARTVRDSSLSAGTQAVLAAEVGHLGLAYDYLVEAAFTDLHDLHENVNNGLHMASLAGAWMALVAGFGGMRDHGGELTFAPRLPAALTRFSFRMAFQGTRISIDVCETEATYRIVDGTELKTRHHGEPITITAGEETPTLAESSRMDPRSAIVVRC